MGQARRRATKAEMLQKKKRAMDLLALGHTYQEIADDIGYANRSAARGLIETELKAEVNESARGVRMLRAQELLNLQQIEAKLLPVILNSNLSEMPGKMLYPYLETIDRIVKIKERRAKMLGLDESEEVQLTGGGQIQVIIDGQVVEKKRSEVEVEVPSNDR